MFPRPAIDRLEEIGSWMQVQGESIYGTTASPLHGLTWGRCTSKRTSTGTCLYLHVFQWPVDGILKVPGVQGAPQMTYFLDDPDRKPLRASIRDDGVAIDVGKTARNPNDTVIVMDITNDVRAPSR